MIVITSNISLHESELTFAFIASPGPGGQNVNKVATAVQLRFNVLQSLSLPEDVRTRLIALVANKLTNSGELIIKASSHRTQERNKHDAIARLVALIKQVAIPPRKRKKTRLSRATKERRLSTKKLHGAKKSSRQIKHRHQD